MLIRLLQTSLGRVRVSLAACPGPRSPRVCLGAGHGGHGGSQPPRRPASSPGWLSDSCLPVPPARHGADAFPPPQRLARALLKCVLMPVPRPEPLRTPLRRAPALPPGGRRRGPSWRGFSTFSPSRLRVGHAAVTSGSHVSRQHAARRCGDAGDVLGSRLCRSLPRCLSEPQKADAKRRTGGG